MVIGWGSCPVDVLIGGTHNVYQFRACRGLMRVRIGGVSTWCQKWCQQTSTIVDAGEREIG